MGASGSAPIPRVSKKLGDTTTQLQHLPPLLSPDCVEGVRVATLARNQYLAGEFSSDGDSAIASTHKTLIGLVQDARHRGHFRDYLVLLLEDARLGLLTGSHGIPSPLLELACLVNPFLQPVGVEAEEPTWDGVKFAPTFRTADLGLVTESEKDLLVLLYYSARVSDSGDEPITFVGRYIEQHATAHKLTRRKESLAETEIFVHWIIFRLVPTLAGKEQQLHLSDTATADLQAEISDQTNRLMALCTMLLGEHRLDQICLLLSMLDTYASREAQPYVPPILRRLARGMKRKRADRPSKLWHKATADRLLEDLKSRRQEARDKWGRRAGVRVGVGQGLAEREDAKFKKD